MQGETIDLEYEVLDNAGAPADLAGATIEFSLKFPDGTVETIDTSILLNVVSVALLTDKTTQAGQYTYQFSVSVTDQNKKKLGVFRVNKAVKI